MYILYTENDIHEEMAKKREWDTQSRMAYEHIACHGARVLHFKLT